MWLQTKYKKKQMALYRVEDSMCYRHISAIQSLLNNSFVAFLSVVYFRGQVKLSHIQIAFG